jgi:molecular chaperone Hsp33
MSDILVRAISKEAGLRGVVCGTLDLAREAVRRHAAYPIAAAALGYGMTAGALLGALLKVQERAALKVEGDGRLRKMIIEADAYGRVRGYVAVPDAVSPRHIDRAAVRDAVGRRGVLTVVKDLRVKDLYRSVVTLESGELDRELEHYMTVSEQVPTLVRIGVGMADDGQLAVAGGLLFQTMPGNRPGMLDQIAARLDDQPPLETLLTDGLTPEEILAQAFGPVAYEILERQPLEFRCSCSRDRSRQGLKMLDAEDILALLAEGEAVVDCHFCHARYEFDRKEFDGVQRELKAPG